MGCRVAAFTAIVVIVILELISTAALPAIRSKRSDEEVPVHHMTTNSASLKLKVYDKGFGTVHIDGTDSKESDYPLSTPFPSRSAIEDYRFRSDAGTHIKVKFNAFNISQKPYEDYLSGYSGFPSLKSSEVDQRNDEDSPLIFTTIQDDKQSDATVIKADDEFETYGNELRIIFVHSYRDGGDRDAFDIELVAVPSPTPQRARLQGRELFGDTTTTTNSRYNVCSAEDNDPTKLDLVSSSQDSGTITSHASFTNPGAESGTGISEIPYKLSSRNCRLDILADEDDEITFIVQYISIDTGLTDRGDCKNNYFSISGEDSNKNNKTTGPLCNGKAALYGPFYGPLIIIQFVTDTWFEADEKHKGFWMTYTRKKKVQMEDDMVTETTEITSTTKPNTEQRKEELPDLPPAIFYIGATVVALLLIVVLSVAGVVACMRTHQQDQLISLLTERIADSTHYSPVGGSIQSLKQPPFGPDLRPPGAPSSIISGSSFRQKAPELVLQRSSVISIVSKPNENTHEKSNLLMSSPTTTAGSEKSNDERTNDVSYTAVSSPEKTEDETVNLVQHRKT